VRNVAEATTLGVSVVIILGIAGALVYRAFHSHDPYLVIEAHALAGEARRAGDRWVVPVEVRNAGDRTATRVTIAVTVEGESAAASSGTADATESYDAHVEYLGGRSRRRVYVYLDRAPGRAPIEARVVHYSVD
jgi:uncharacterized protein (TIGR02588 family)